MKQSLCAVSMASAIICIALKGAIAGTAYESLVAAASADRSAMSVVFDGAVPLSATGMQPVFSGRDSFRGQVYPLRQQVLPPVPEPVNIADVDTGAEKARLSLDSPMDPKTEAPIMDRGLSALGKTASGKPLADFFKTEGVELRWAPMGTFNAAEPDARVCPPEECGGKKIIYLNNDKEHKELYFDANPTFLAVVLAHELTHLDDFKSIGSGVKKGTQQSLFLELNGWSTETYVYHQLLVAGIAPDPGSLQETKKLAQVRLHLGIRNYVNKVNGEKLPMAADYLQLVRDGFDFGAYLEDTINPERTGLMSLAGVVERNYDLPESFETIQDPGFFASSEKKKQYKQCKELKEAVGLSTAKYIEWRKQNVDPKPPPQIDPPLPTQPSQPQQPTQPQQPPPPPPQHPPGGEDNGGGSSGGGSGNGNTPTIPGWANNPNWDGH